MKFDIRGYKNHYHILRITGVSMFAIGEQHRDVLYSENCRGIYDLLNAELEPTKSHYNTGYYVTQPKAFRIENNVRC